MKVYHQAGHNLVWNLDSFRQDQSGDGIIFSPVNDSPSKILNIEPSVRAQSFFDPQFYMPASGRGKLQEYPFFPSAVLDGFTTGDYETACWGIAKGCVDWQIAGGFSSLVVPVRYYGDIPSDYFTQISSCYVDPFISAVKERGFNGPVLLTVILKHGQIVDEQQRNFFLNWLTGMQGIDGVYLIFEHSSPNKQIKDPIFLANCMRIIKILKDNGIGVFVGYNNTEGILFSLADPDSISMGVYENLRRFDSKRFEERETKGGQQPNPRLYSARLFQWIEFTYVQAIQQLYSQWGDLFESNKYTPLDFQPGKNWNLKQPELYKHFFEVFSGQVFSLPEDLSERFEFLREAIEFALAQFKGIAAAGVPLDENSDGSHLNAWLTAMSLFRKM